jgi:hypothetical protein
MVAACWSPATPSDRDRPAEQRRLVVPKSAALSGPRAASTAGTRKSRSSSSSQAPVGCCRQQRARGVGGVGGMHVAPPVRRQIRKLSTVPKASSPRSARLRAPVTLSSSQASLVPRNRGRDQAGLRRHHRLDALGFFSLAQNSAVRRSCQTMALWIGLPVVRSQTTVVSRWLVMPIAAMSAAFKAGLRHRPAHGVDGRRPEVFRIVLDPARQRIVLRELRLRDGDDGQVRREHDRPRRSGPLVDGDEVCGHGEGTRGGVPPLPGGGTDREAVRVGPVNPNRFALGLTGPHLPRLRRGCPPPWQGEDALRLPHFDWASAQVLISVS